MKKTLLSVALCASVLTASESIIGEMSPSPEVEKNMVSFDVGTWYMNWNQTSTSAEMLSDSTQAIDINYNIDSSMAYVLAFKFDYWYLSGGVEYSNNSLGSGSEESISNLDLGVALLDYIPFLGVELRYVKADFKGKMSAVDASNTDLTTGYGSSIFETKVDIFDIVIYPFNDYIGVGYRNYNYEFPQDAYVTRDSDGTSIQSGLVDLAYEGYFYTLAVDNKKQVDKLNSYNGFVYSALFGMGKLTPSALVNERTSASDAAVIDAYLGDSDATFYDILLGYSYKTKDDDGFGYGLTAGYRYNKIEADASDSVDNNGYSIKTKFDTEFHGPFINLVVSY